MLNSIQEQTHDDIEHIIIDGNSNDGTKEYLEKNRGDKSIFISEADDGMYDALNKGIKLATGKVIGMLHSDDYFASNNIIAEVVKIFNKNKVEAVFGDVEYVNKLDKVTRYYSSKNFNYKKLAYGVIPAHTSLFLDNSVLYSHGTYNSQFKFAGDFEYMARIFKDNSLSYYHAPVVFTKMTIGGLSNQSLLSRINTQKEIMHACRINGIKTNYLKLSLRYLGKMIEFKI